MDSGDFLGNLGQRRIIGLGIFKSVVRHSDGVRAAVPFAHKACARLQAEARRRTNPAGRSQGFRDGLQLAAGRFTETAVFDFLLSIADRPDE